MAQHELLVKLGLQSDSFSRNIRNVNNQLKLTEAEFNKLESSTKNFGNSKKDLEAKIKSLSKTQEQLTAKTILYRKRIDELNNKIEESESKHNKLTYKIEKEKIALEKLEEASGKNSKAYKEKAKTLKGLQAEYDKSKREIELLNLSLQSNKIELAKTETELNKVKRAISDVSFDKATLGFTKFSDNLSKVSSKLDTISNKVGSVGKTLSATVTAPIAAAGASVIKFGAEFSSSMSEVQALSGATGNELKELENKAREMGKATSFTAKEAADGLGYMALAGWKTKQMLEGIEPVLRLAEAGNFDLATASDLVTDSMSSLGLEVDDLSKYLDIVAKSSSKSNTSVEQMLRTYNQVGGTFQRFNVPLEESGALIGVLANRGLKAEQAGRSLSSILINLTGGSTTASKAMDALNVSAYDSKGKFKGVETVLKDLHKELYKVENGTAKYTEEQRNSYLAMIGGKTQIRTLDALLNGVAKTTSDGTTEFEKLRKELINSEGALSEMSATMKDNLQGDWEKFTSAVGELKLQIYDLVKGPIREFVQGLTKLIEKFISLDSDTQKFIVKVGLIAAAIGPVLLVVSAFFKGLSLLTGGFANAIRGGVGFAKNITELIKGTKSFSSVLGIAGGTVAGLPVLIGAAVAALVGLAAAIGNNESALGWMIDKWGMFGEALSRVCEFITGTVQFVFGNLLTIIQTGGKALGALIKGKFWEIDDILAEGGKKIETTNMKAWSNIKGESTKALKIIRNSTAEDMEGVNSVFKTALEKLPTLTKDNLGTVAKEFTNTFKSAHGDVLDLSENSIKVLRGTSDTMSVLFSGIRDNMDIDQATTIFSQNMEKLLSSGKITLKDLEKEFEKSGSLIEKHLSDGMKRANSEAKTILDELGDIAKRGMEPVAKDVATIIDGMSSETIKTLRGMGSNWNTLFKGISADGKMNVDEMKKVILGNLEDLNLDTPGKIEKFKSTLISELDKAKEAAKTSTDGTAEEIADNLVPDGDTTAKSTKEQLDKNTTAVKTAAEDAKNASKQGGKDVADAFKEGVDSAETADINLSSKVDKAAEEAKTVAGKKGGEVVTSISNSMDTEMPQVDKVTQKISDRLSKIDNIKLGNVTKQLSEINRWLGVCNGTAGTLKASMTRLTSLPFGNTTKGLSEVNRWLNTVNSTSKNTRSSIVLLTSLKWGNTTKGLSEVNKWLKTVDGTSKTTKTSMAQLTSLKWGNTTKGLSEVNKWLGTVKNSAATAKTYLQSMTNVKFGSVTKGLSEVNRWLGIVAGKASTAKTAISSVSAARPKSITVDENAMQALARTQVAQPTLYNFRTNYGEDFINRMLPKATSNAVEVNKAENSNNDDLVTAVFALVEALTNKQMTTILNMDAKPIAQVTAPLIRSEIKKIDTRRNRIAGIG